MLNEILERNVWRGQRAGRWLKEQLFRSTRHSAIGFIRLLSCAWNERIELVPVVRAFAADQSPRYARKLGQFCDMIEAKVAFPDAIEQIPGLVPDEAILALRCGAQMGTLPLTLRQLVENYDHEEASSKRPIVAWLVYLAIIALWGIPVLAFVLIKTAPVMNVLVEDIAPGADSWMHPLVRLLVANAHYLSFLFIPLLVVAWLFWTGRIRRSLARGWLSWVVRPFGRQHMADLLSEFHVAALRGRPMEGVVSTLARYHYDPIVRRRLLFVRNEVEHGADLWSTLRQAKLLDSRDVTLLSSAARGDSNTRLPWLLHAMADNRRRQQGTWREIFAELLLPLTVLAWGAIVMSIAWSVFRFMSIVVSWGS